MFLTEQEAKRYFEASLNSLFAIHAIPTNNSIVAVVGLLRLSIERLEAEAIASKEDNCAKAASELEKAKGLIEQAEKMISKYS